MLRWRLTITASPVMRFAMARRRLARQWPMLAALVALVSTLVLGQSGAPLPLFRDAPIELPGLAGIAGVGMLAWHFARLSVLPLAESHAAALVAALIPAILLPGMGANALIAPLTISLWTLWRGNGQRVVALLVQCGALAAIAEPAGGDFATSFGYAIMLGTALFLALKTLSGAANDNPSMERVGQIQRLPLSSGYASAESIPGKWGVS